MMRTISGGIRASEGVLGGPVSLLVYSSFSCSRDPKHCLTLFKVFGVA